MRKIYKIIISAFFIMSLIGSWGNPALATNNTCELKIEVSFGQTEARAMLKRINSFRLSKDAWQYDENNNKIDVTGLDSLIYDYELEKTAMQRAAEIAVSFSHTRPNGEVCFTAFSSYWSAGENIAAGYTTEKSVFEAWKEDNELYAGQGHRRNMLSSDFTAVGIGHVRYNGRDYWVQEFRNPAVNTTPTGADNGNAVVTVEITNDKIQTLTLSASQNTISLSEGETTKLTGIEANVVLTDGKTIPYADAPILWKSSDETIMKMSGGSIEGIREGNAVLTGTFSLGQKNAQIQINVQVIGSSTSGWLIGDVNCDKAVDANDLTKLARHLSKIESFTDSEQLKAADTNRDNTVNASDLTMLAKYVARIIPVL